LYATIRVSSGMAWAAYTLSAHTAAPELLAGPRSR